MRRDLSCFGGHLRLVEAETVVSCPNPVRWPSLTFETEVDNFASSCAFIFRSLVCIDGSIMLQVTDTCLVS